MEFPPLTVHVGSGPEWNSTVIAQVGDPAEYQNRKGIHNLRLLGEPQATRSPRMTWSSFPEGHRLYMSSL